MLVFMYRHSNTAQGNECTNNTVTFTTQMSFCPAHTKMDIKHIKNKLSDIIQCVNFSNKSNLHDGDC